MEKHEDRFRVESRNDDYEYWNVLIDTESGEEVFDDSMEPEDASLRRDLRPLVRLLNSRAAEQRAERAEADRDELARQKTQHKQNITEAWKSRDEAKSRAELAEKAVEVLRDALQNYVLAQSRMANSWAEGDKAVKRELLRKLYCCEDAGRAVLAATEPGGEAGE